MSLVTVPDQVSSAATSLADIGSTLSAANSAVAVQTTQVLAAGSDGVSQAVAAVFGAHVQDYQALSVQAESFYQHFVQALNANADAYASTEAANASPLQTVQQELIGLINAPTQAPQMLRALARALRLTYDETDHLYRLAGHAVPTAPGFHCMCGPP